MLLERDAEQAALQAAIDRVAHGAGVIAVVHGAAGIGKTELLRWGGAQAERDAFLVLRARGSELECDFPFGLVHQLFDGLLARGEIDRERLLAGAAALAEPLLTEQAPVLAAPVDPAYPLLHGLYWLLANVATCGPVALLVDDAHWSDAASARYLEFLLPRLEDLPVGLLLAAREGEAGPAEPLLGRLCANPDIVQVRPAPLSPAVTRELVELELGTPPAGEFAAACHEVTAGNPFFLRELLLYVRAEGIPPSAANAGQVRVLAPETVSRSVLVRLAQLPPHATRLAQAVAVLGDEADLRHLAPLAELSDGELASTAASLIRARLFEDRSPPRFIHPIVRASVYNDLTAVERAAAHGRAARILTDAGEEPERIGLHLLSSEPRGDRNVVGILRVSAERAAARGASQAARRYLERALREPPPAADVALLKTMLGEGLLSVGDPTGVAMLLEARAAAADERRLFAAAGALARALAASGRIAEALEHAEADAERLRATGEAGCELAMQLQAELTILVQAVDYGAYAPVRGRLARYTKLLGNTPAERLVLAAAATDLAGVAMYEITSARSARNVGPLDEVRDLAERALGDGALLEDFGTAHPAVFSAAFALMLVDRFDQAARHLDMAIERARRDGVVFGFVLASSWRSSVAWLSGDVTQAAAHAGAAIEAARLHAWALPFPAALRAALDALIERGELTEAEQLLQSSPLAAGIPRLSLAVGVLFARARLRIASGRVDEAIADLHELGDWLRNWSFESFAVPWRATLATVLASRDRDAAVMLAREELKLARRWNSARRVGVALRACGLVHGGEEGLRLLRQSVETLDSSPAKLEHAHSLTELGAATRRGGHRAEAREILRQALETAHRAGAIALEEQTRTELLATGARPRRIMRTGIEALTPSERRICGLAAQGKTNREIAQDLFVTIKTVEMHMRNGYLKLDIKSRDQLPRLFPQPDTRDPAPPSTA